MKTHARSPFLLAMIALVLLWAVPAHADAKRAGGSPESDLASTPLSAPWSAMSGAERLTPGHEALESTSEQVRTMERLPQAEESLTTLRPRVIVIVLGPIVVIIVIGR